VSPCACDSQNARGCAADQRVGTQDAGEFIDTLIMRYPRLFRGLSLPYPSYVPGPWQATVLSLFDDLDHLLDDALAQAFVVSQIRSKYGRLRIYCWLDETAVHHLSTEELRDAGARIAERVAASERTAPSVGARPAGAPQGTDAAPCGQPVSALQRAEPFVASAPQRRMHRHAGR
jgi:hypothetical protein